MPRIFDITPKRRRSASVAAAVVLTSALCYTSLAGPARAEEHGWDRHEDRHGDPRHRDWDRGYYRAPPVVYRTPYYAPPVVYSPGWSGLNINIR